MILFIIPGYSFTILVIVCLLIVFASVVAILRIETNPLYRFLLCLLALLVPPFAVCYLLYAVLKKDNNKG